MKIILIGGGKLVYFLAKQFIAQNHGVTVINRSPEESRRLSRQLAGTIVLGEGSDPETMEAAGVRRADVLLAMTPQDHDNLVACQIAKDRFEVPRTIALVNDPDNEAIFRRLGVSVVFSATRIVSGLLEQHAGFEAVTELAAMAGGRVHVSEVRLEEGAPAAGKTLQALKLPPGVLLAAVVRGDAVLVPSGATALAAGDRLVLIGQADRYADGMRMLTGG